jgi:radical SAM superfamily enzyme YgiQ (UPF0313 family)
MLKKKVLIIQPSFYLPGRDGVAKRRTKAGFVPPLISPYLASFFDEKEFEVRIRDEVIHEVRFDIKYDLVLIPYITANAQRAYELGDLFMRQGAKVVMGGYHAAVCREEAQAHCDCLVAGEFEIIWDEFINDFYSGALKKIYTAPHFYDMRKIRMPRYDLIDWHRFSSPFDSTVPMETSRGCPHGCDFCSINIMHGKDVRYRPVDEVIEHVDRVVKDLKIWKPQFLFVDEKMSVTSPRNIELMEKLILRRVKWRSFFTADSYKQPGFIELAAKAGCTGAIVGFDSINRETMKEIDRKAGTMDDYMKTAEIFRKHGILVYGLAMAGAPGDNAQSIKNVLAAVTRLKLPYAHFYPVCPFPGTRLYERFKKEGLLRDEKFWLKKHDYYKLVKNPMFEPPEKGLESAFKEMLSKHYSAGAILKRSLASKHFFRVLAENTVLGSLSRAFDIYLEI